MGKGIFYIIFFISLFSFSNTTLAITLSNKSFGGKIISAPKALEVILAESSGFVCPIVGTTFNIKPVTKSPNGPYLIQPLLSNSKKTQPKLSENIVGTYNKTKTQITCINTMSGITKTLSFYKVNIFNSSK